MAQTIRVRPRKGIILAGIPASGADVPRELAEEWLANRLVTRIDPPARPAKAPARPAEGK